MIRNKFIPKIGDVIKNTRYSKDKKYIWLEFESGLELAIENFENFIEFKTSDKFFDDEAPGTDILKTI